MSHVIDSERAALISEFRAAEERLAQLDQQLKAERKLLLKEVRGSRVDPLKQWGTRMAHTEFEMKLAPHLPSSVFYGDHPKNPAMRWLYQVVNGQQVYISAYAKGLMPEASIHFLKQAVRPIASVIGSAVVKGNLIRNLGGTTLSGKDMPKMMSVPNPEAPGGFELVPAAGGEEAAMPGWTKEDELGPERVRGWRTVLLYLKAQGFITGAIIEAVFGAADTPEWQGHIGKARVSTPW